MCTGKCSRCIGITLFPLAACAIVSNILLYFPNGQVLQLSEITDLVWFFQGILGAGILVILPAFMMLGAGGAGCCANRCGMLLSVLLALLGFAGGVYCAVFSSMGLIGGPLCDTGDGEYLYPFRNNTLEYNYLFNQTTWSICKEPENIILWNIVLFSILLAIGVIEAILCLIQVTNGLIGFVCGTCMRRRKHERKPSVRTQTFHIHTWPYVPSSNAAHEHVAKAGEGNVSCAKKRSTRTLP